MHFRPFKFSAPLFVFKKYFYFIKVRMRLEYYGFDCSNLRTGSDLGVDATACTLSKYLYFSISCYFISVSRNGYKGNQLICYDFAGIRVKPLKKFSYSERWCDTGPNLRLPETHA